jgi:hypothetical protein
MPARSADPSPPELHELSDLVWDGLKLLHADQTAEACDRWLQAWELVKKLAMPDMRSVKAFDDAYYHDLPERVFNWCQDLEEALGNAGLDNQAYHEHRVRYAREFLDQFPQTDTLMYLNFRRAEGEALWRLGRQSEAEAVFAALVESLPDEAWSYIGWADEYWVWNFSSKDYARAEEIMQRALARPGLKDRRYVLERIEEMYTEWGKPDRAAEMRAQLQQPEERAVRPVSRPLSPPVPVSREPVIELPRPGRNDPCWCGSGKKYKHCHLRSDEEQRRGR